MHGSNNLHFFYDATFGVYTEFGMHLWIRLMGEKMHQTAFLLAASLSFPRKRTAPNPGTMARNFTNAATTWSVFFHRIKLLRVPLLDTTSRMSFPRLLFCYYDY